MSDARIGLDIGGTFTDIVLEHAGRRVTAKVLTTPGDPATGALAAIDAGLAAAGVTADAVTQIVHGTTLATNALIERKGARTALITTQGFRDTIEIGTEGRPDQYDTNLDKPPPLVKRRHRFPIHERLNARGEVLIALDPAEIEALVPTLDAAGIESVAIGFIHSYVNSAHERGARDVLRRLRPDLPVTLSSEVSPEFREYERFVTACANAYVQPLMAGYLRRFETALTARGFRCPLLLIVSSGGLASVETAARFPIRLVESGPAGGAIFAAGLARRDGLDRVLSFDMGGTTAKICVIDDAKPQTSRAFEIARMYRFKKGSGLPVRIPVIEMVEIGAGGGSIARIDALGRLTVGPDSAGADPGPACYTRGGLEPTVTDADVVLGRVDPAHFAGGRMKLDAQAADDAVTRTLTGALGIATPAAAFGIAETVEENMAQAARIHAIESGATLPGRTLIAFGGAAPLHAARLAEKLDIERVLVPRGAGVGSAVGFLRAPASYEIVRTLYQKLGSFEPARVGAELTMIAEEARSFVRIAAAKDASIETSITAFMRYAGQGHEIAVDLPLPPYAVADAARFKRMFETAYERLYGRTIGDLADVEITAWAVRASAPPVEDLAPRGATVAAAAAPKRRTVFDPSTQAFVDMPVHYRSSLAAGDAIPGPALIAEDETTSFVTSAFVAHITKLGDIEMTRRSQT